MDEDNTKSLTDDIEIGATDTENLTEPPLTEAHVAMAGELIDRAVTSLNQALRILGKIAGNAGKLPKIGVDTTGAEDDDSQVIEGVFDGQKMIGPDGKHYAVPSNYASKSKLVEGDLLKLIITSKGAFVYKQIGPVPRKRLMGTLMASPLGGEFLVDVGEKKYRVLTASATYFRGKPGDEAVILVPENGESQWGAVENIIKKES